MDGHLRQCREGVKAAKDVPTLQRRHPDALPALQFELARLIEMAVVLTDGQAAFACSRQPYGSQTKHTSSWNETMLPSAGP